MSIKAMEGHITNGFRLLKAFITPIDIPCSIQDLSPPRVSTDWYPCNSPFLMKKIKRGLMAILFLCSIRIPN
jgi:hypothetical protein